METEEKQIICPLMWQTSVVECFCEVPLASGSAFLSVEVQIVSRNNITGLLVLVYRKAGGLDLYYENSLQLDMEWALVEPATSHLKIMSLSPVSFSRAICEIQDRLVNIDLSFVDVSGLLVEVHVSEEFEKNSIPMFTPAAPQSFPAGLRFILMNNFRLLPSNAAISVAVNGVQQTIKGFFLPRKFSYLSATKLGASFVLGSLVPVNVGDKHNGRSNTLSNEQSNLDQSPWFKLSGFPTLEQVRNIDSSVLTEQKFVIESSHGVVARGTYSMSIDKDIVSMSIINLKQDWKPVQMSVGRIMLRFIRLLRRRNESWQLDSQLQISPNLKWLSPGKWKN